MALSLDAVKELMNTFRVRFAVGMNIERDAPAWQATLLRAGMTEANKDALWRGFVDGYPPERRLPRLDDLARYCAGTTAMQRQEERDAAAREAEARRLEKQIAEREARPAGWLRNRLRRARVERGLEETAVEDVPEDEIPF